MQGTYKRNIEARPRNRFCRGKATSITYSECVSVALVIQHPKCMRHIVFCGLSGSTIFFRHYLADDTQVTENKMYVLIRSNKAQQYVGIYLLQVYSTCFGRPSRP